MDNRNTDLLESLLTNNHLESLIAEYIKLLLELDNGVKH